MAAPDPTRELDRDVALAAAAHQELLAALDLLVDSGTLDVGAPSRLPDWTRGHVLAHIRQSGDGNVRMLEAAMRGDVGRQYPGGLAGRAADIEAEAALPAEEQVDRLRRSIWTLEGCWASSSWVGSGEAPFGVIQMVDLPFARLREVAIHHVDLDIGYDFDDLPEPYVVLELRRMEMRWEARQPEGMTQLPSLAVAADPRTRLGWLMGRLEIDGLAPASIL
jgi:maleylpyruvate isomerase